VLKQLKGFYTDANGNFDITKMIPLMAGLFSANKSNNNTQPSGYQGGIPTYTAERMAPTAGSQLSGNVVFKKPDGTVVNPVSQGLPTAAAANPRLDALLKTVGYGSTGVATPRAAPATPAPSTPARSPITLPVAYPEGITAIGAPEAKAAGGGLKSGGFVIPADVVSHMGNGSSDAGLKILASKLGATPIRGRGDGMSDSIPTSIDGRQKALVAHEEAYMSPAKVAALGGGDPKKGAQKLRAMMDSIRRARTGSAEQGKQIDPNKFMPGGEVHRFNNGGSTGTTGVGTAASAGVTGTESNLSNWAGPYVTDMLAKGKALSELPYEAYTGPLTAGASNLQTKGFEGLAGIGFPGNFGKSFTDSGIAGSYMNPYLNEALQPQLAEMRRQAQINLQPSLTKLTQAGGYGGGRQAIMESEAARNLLQEQDKLVKEGYATAFDKAMGQFNTEQTQGKSLADLFASQGATERNIAQDAITAEKTEFEKSRENPYKMVQYQKSLLEGLPTTAQTYNMADSDNLSQFATGFSTIYQTLKSLGIIK
jgi:hypothetical protein